MCLMRALVTIVSLSICACASTLQVPAEIDIVLLGEQHDAPRHQQIHREVVEALAAERRLAAVALEMADQGTSTAGLLPAASEAGVQVALRWNDEAWPWKTYGPAVMAAVRAGVPVLGANMPRDRMRGAMADSSLDTLISGPALQAQQRAIRKGHCDLLPESQIVPMTRMQIARDLEMAATIVRYAIAGKTVLLLAGAGHVDPALGVPLHLPASLRVQATVLPAEPHAKDYCAELRQRMRPAP